VWTHLETYFLQNGLPRWNQILMQLRLVSSRVIMGIQWMVGCWFTMSKKEPQLMEHRPLKYAQGRGVHETYLKWRFDLLDLFYFNKPNMFKTYWVYIDWRWLETNLSTNKITNEWYGFLIIHRGTTQGKLAWSPHLDKGTKLPAQNKNSHLGHDTSDLIIYRISPNGSAQNWEGGGWEVGESSR